jgi:hypothetical protein
LKLITNIFIFFRNLENDYESSDYGCLLVSLVIYISDYVLVLCIGYATPLSIEERMRKESKRVELREISHKT